MLVELQTILYILNGKTSGHTGTTKSSAHTNAFTKKVQLP